MHIASVVNPNTNSAGDVCVLLLSYGENMVFVGKPRTYEKLEKVAREEFSLDESAAVVFETSTLDICRQQKVRISKGAYGAMWQCLDALFVAVKPVEKSLAGMQVTNPPVASSSRHIEVPTLSAAPIENEAASENDDDEAEEEEVKQPPPPRNRRAPANRVMSTPPPEHGDATEEIPQEEDEDEGEDGPPSDSPSTEGPGNEVNEQEEEEPSTRAVSEPEHQKENEEEEAAEEEEEEEEEEEAGVNAAAPVHEADVDEQQETPESPRRPVARQESLDDREWAEARASSIIRPPISAPRTPLGQTASIPGTPTQSAAAQTPSSSQVVVPPWRASASSSIRRSIRSPRPAAPPVIAAHIYPPGSQASETSSRTVTPTYEPPNSQHLHITITYEDQSVEFKTRGRHTIKKVLTSACGQFGLDPRRAALALERNANSEIVSATCSPEMTLAACGVTDGSQFIIRMD
ncbi:hypothetical protein BDN71DRAFT_1004663 [Pleurotus eryngii]|uniref:Uncharacterized protein n=1 Tax=Pleurotus eryngii TaxID=5323 RepID=A0A9P6D7I3_PLEER|nr:hypothetical protein BDN71DRAFT_1004663 [Pleurotus eryngii]